ncbi:hypothetical protein TTHERM_000646999 (macronuclear) [Tetrahymena thermophila SB210]|uniref:Uncharacterized protein n=1 Tax=Tetrahymena thermophila (strain SB210) TaxID=312017 RepID=W7X3S9_TETTS|nr:hypothetical protein TTHERM_000646999 [Tetrahymena thermophila SB210]EWS71078.1 hypothetical protein TTHERM_000646999 [Tetrahymena thermophila SB210]|eukprot:XP_012656377.1 hypothetical protein TTHERM_000646999 [Tetrahymena thermophila SB210]
MNKDKNRIYLLIRHIIHFIFNKVLRKCLWIQRNFKIVTNNNQNKNRFKVMKVFQSKTNKSILQIHNNIYILLKISCFKKMKNNVLNKAITNNQQTQLYQKKRILKKKIRINSSQILLKQIKKQQFKMKNLLLSQLLQAKIKSTKNKYKSLIKKIYYLKVNQQIVNINYV